MYYLSRFLGEATDQRMAVSPRSGGLVVALHDDSLLAGMASLKDDHDLAGLQQTYMLESHMTNLGMKLGNGF